MDAQQEKIEVLQRELQGLKDRISENVQVLSGEGADSVAADTPDTTTANPEIPIAPPPPPIDGIPMAPAFGRHKHMQQYYSARQEAVICTLAIIAVLS